MSIFIDVIKIIRPKNIEIIVKVKIKLIIAFKIVDIRLISFYLSLKIDKDC